MLAESGEPPTVPRTNQEIVMGSSAVLRRSAAERTSVWTLALAFGLLLAGPHAALAGFCGDDVDGERVACACGDEVVSDATLSPGDPITAAPCTGDGLVVSVPRGSDGVTVDLGGVSIVGSGRGIGIRVVDGGRLGSRIVGGGPESALAEISNFRTGIRASGTSDLVEVSNVRLYHNSGDGLHVASTGVRVVDVISEQNGRDGVSVVGKGAEVGGVVADSNADDGVSVRGRGASVSAEATGNLGHGLIVSGRGNRVDNSASSGNGGLGIMTSGSDLEVGDVEIGDNLQGDMKGRAKGTSGVAR
jgi:hypothetical protein